MKNFRSNGFKKSDSPYEGKSSFGDGRKQTGRYDMGRGARTESRRDDAPELFKTTCTTCGKPCEVPFRPDGIKPVLCRDCFATKNAAGTMPVRTTANDRTARQYEAPYTPAPRTTEKNNLNYAVLAKQLGAIETKVNKVLELIQPTERKVASTVIIEATDSVVKKTRKPKSTSPAVKKAAVKKKVAKKAAVAKKQA